MIKICVFTGGRAEYGLLNPLLYKIDADQDLELQLFVSGMHLCPEFGMTKNIIENDGFQIDEAVEMILSSDTPSSTAKSIGLGIISFADALTRLRPDYVLTLGDRFENFAFCATAWTLRIPIIHIQGGEVTSGALDDQYRHCISKLSHFHFTATETYRRRVIQLGEAPERVFNVGALNVEALSNINILDQNELSRLCNFPVSKKTILVTFHPSTLDSQPSSTLFSELLIALDEIKSEHNFIFTKTLADTDGRIINDMIDQYALANSEIVLVSTSLGQLKYISALHHVGLVIGNSSSGIIETASIPVATIDIGMREQGRIKPDNVIWASCNSNEILAAIRQAKSASHAMITNNVTNPYFKENTSENIISILRTLPENVPKHKEFYDVEFK